MFDGEGGDWWKVFVSGKIPNGAPWRGFLLHAETWRGPRDTRTRMAGDRWHNRFRKPIYLTNELRIDGIIESQRRGDMLALSAELHGIPLELHGDFERCGEDVALEVLEKRFGFSLDLVKSELTMGRDYSAAIGEISGLAFSTEGWACLAHDHAAGLRVTISSPVRIGGSEMRFIMKTNGGAHVFCDDGSKHLIGYSCK